MKREFLGYFRFISIIVGIGCVCFWTLPTWQVLVFIVIVSAFGAVFEVAPSKKRRKQG